MSDITGRSDSASAAFRLAGAALAGAAATVATSGAHAEIIGATGLSQLLLYGAGTAGTTFNIGGMPGVNVSHSSKSFTVESDPTIYTSHWVYLESTTGLVSYRLADNKGPQIIGTDVMPGLARADVARRDPSSAGGYHPISGGGSGYYGLSFNDGAGVRYGWVSISMQSSKGPSPSSPFVPVLTGWGYETTGAPILAGAISTPVPEPASLLMLTAGAIGLGLKRRRDSAVRRAQVLAS